MDRYRRASIASSLVISEGSSSGAGRLPDVRGGRTPPARDQVVEPLDGRRDRNDTSDRTTAVHDFDGLPSSDASKRMRQPLSKLTDTDLNHVATYDTTSCERVRPAIPAPTEKPMATERTPGTRSEMTRSPRDSDYAPSSKRRVGPESAVRPRAWLRRGLLRVQNDSADVGVGREILVRLRRVPSGGRGRRVRREGRGTLDAVDGGTGLARATVSEVHLNIAERRVREHGHARSGLGVRAVRANCGGGSDIGSRGPAVTGGRGRLVHGVSAGSEPGDAHLTNSGVLVLHAGGVVVGHRVGVATGTGDREDRALHWPPGRGCSPSVFVLFLRIRIAAQFTVTDALAEPDPALVEVNVAVLL